MTLQPQRSGARQTVMPKSRQLDEFQERVATAAERQMIETRGTASRKKLMAEFGIGEHAAQNAITRAKGRFERITVDPAELPLTAQQKIDVAIRQRTDELERQHERDVRDEVQRRLEETILPHYKARLADADRVFKARRGVMDRATYRKIRACLHPDRVQEPQLKARYEEAFNLFNQLEPLLLDEKEMPTQSVVIPTTLSGLMELKKKMAENRGQRLARGRI